MSRSWGEVRVHGKDVRMHAVVPGGYGTDVTRYRGMYEVWG